MEQQTQRGSPVSGGRRPTHEQQQHSVKLPAQLPCSSLSDVVWQLLLAQRQLKVTLEARGP